MKLMLNSLVRSTYRDFSLTLASLQRQKSESQTATSKGSRLVYTVLFMTILMRFQSKGQTKDKPLVVKSNEPEVFELSKFNTQDTADVSGGYYYSE